LGLRARYVQDLTLRQLEPNATRHEVKQAIRSTATLAPLGPNRTDARRPLVLAPAAAPGA